MLEIVIGAVLHLSLAVVWVGGMIFAHTILRPAAVTLPLEWRLLLWREVFQRFFRWVWAAVILLPISGYWLLFERFAGISQSPLYVHWMHGVAWVMIGLFVYVYFRLYPRMCHMLKEQLLPEAGLYLAKIRTLVTINLLLGISIVMGVALFR